MSQPAITSETAIILDSDEADSPRTTTAIAAHWTSLLNGGYCCADCESSMAAD